MRPITNSEAIIKVYNKPFYEYLGEDGFTYITKNTEPMCEDKYEIIEGSIYIGHYFNVCNHRASNMMQSSKCDDNIIRTGQKGWIFYGTSRTISVKRNGNDETR